MPSEQPVLELPMQRWNPSTWHLVPEVGSSRPVHGQQSQSISGILAAACKCWPRQRSGAGQCEVWDGLTMLLMEVMIFSIGLPGAFDKHLASQP